jgi:hypothetical protein
LPNWRAQFTRALLGHLNEYREGTWIDPDSGIPHLALVATNAVILLVLEMRDRAGKDSDHGR